jgi:hypothetical protein
MPLLENLTLALNDGKVSMSHDGGCVAIGGEGGVVLYDIVEFCTLNQNIRNITVATSLLRLNS